MKKVIYIAICSVAAIIFTANAMNVKPNKGVIKDTLNVNNHDDATLTARNNVIDEVVWIIGDEPILKSDIEIMRIEGEKQGMKWYSDPDCSIPEQLAIQKLFLHQAALDSIEVSESDITRDLDLQINYFIQMVGSKEKLEEYRNQTIAQIRQEMYDEFKNRQLIQGMKRKLVGNVAVTPAEVRNYFKDLPQDSLPHIPTSVELQIIVKEPKATEAEINRVKNELRSYTERITNGETTFSTIARLYSEDGSARNGGELGYMAKAALDPEFAGVAFNLTDPNKISKIVETEFGYHIIQLIDKKGDKINVRHIILKPKISSEAIDFSKTQLDSISNQIREGKYSFENAASYMSDDKETRNNNGLMASYDAETGSRTSRFYMKDLPSEVARAVENLNVGDISSPFQMTNEKGKNVCAIIKLKSKIDAHRATITEDYQIMKEVVLAKKRTELLDKWIKEKIKTTYIKIGEQYRNCDFEYKGWVK